MSRPNGRPELRFEGPSSLDLGQLAQIPCPDARVVVVIDFLRQESLTWTRERGPVQSSAITTRTPAFSSMATRAGGIPESVITVSISSR